MNKQEQLELACRIRGLGVDPEWRVSSLLAKLEAPESIGPTTAVIELNKMNTKYDRGSLHARADDILVAVLRNVGLDNVADAYLAAATRNEFLCEE